MLSGLRKSSGFSSGGLLWMLAGLLSVQAADWQPVVGVPDGNIHHLDVSKLQIEAAEVTYWRRVSFGQPIQVVSGQASWALFRERIHCRLHTVQQLSWLLYAKNGLIDHSKAPERQVVPIVPDTISDFFAERVCTELPDRNVRKNPSQTPVSSDLSIEMENTVVPELTLTPRRVQ